MAERKVTTKAELLRLIAQAADEGWTELDLSGLGLKELPGEIGKLKSLESLLLSDVAEPKVVENPNAKFFKSLRLNIPHAEFATTFEGQLDTSPPNQRNTSNRLTWLPEQISNLKSLKCLNLSGNPLNKFPNQILRLKSLEKLELDRTGIERIPYDISCLTKLEHLSLRFNKIKSIPFSIKNLERLSFLALSGNELRIPLEISNRKNSPQEIINYLESLGSVDFDLA